MILKYSEARKILKYEKIHKVGKAKFSFGTFYIKRAEYPQNIYEIIGEYMAEAFGLVHPNYILANVKGYNFVLSSDLNERGKFITMDDLNLSSGSMYEIWNTLEKKYNNIASLMYEIVKMFLLDIFTNNYDRHSKNYGIIMIDNTPKIAVFDHALCFDYTKQNSIHSFYEPLSCIGERLTVNLLNFLKTSSQEYIEFFDKIYRRFTPDYFSQLLSLIEKREEVITTKSCNNLVIPNKQKLIDTYTENYELITKVYEEYKRELGSDRNV